MVRITSTTNLHRREDTLRKLETSGMEEERNRRLMSSCLNHSRFTILQSPPLSQARIADTVRCSEDLSDKVRSEGVFGYGSGLVSCESPSLKRFNQ
ncbi:hypothetical protein YC2023_041985 [Brassica napus]